MDKYSLKYIGGVIIYSFRYELQCCHAVEEVGTAVKGRAGKGKSLQNRSDEYKAEQGRGSSKGKGIRYTTGRNDVAK